VTLLLSAFPHLEAATRAILLQADEILVEPIEPMSLVDVSLTPLAIGPVPDRKMKASLQLSNAPPSPPFQEWYRLTLNNDLLTSVPTFVAAICPGWAVSLWRAYALQHRSAVEDQCHLPTLCTV
jgi:hypothetical protein